MNNLTKVYLIRHSKQLILNGNMNKDEDNQISNEKIILSVEGEKLANKLANINELKDIDILWSSNYVRAVSTAKYIANKNDININIDSNLDERKLRRFKRIKKTR